MFSPLHLYYVSPLAAFDLMTQDQSLPFLAQILSSNHLLSTTFLALHAFLTDRHKTRTPHSELVFRLSPNNNIGESYKKFGLSDSTTNLIAVKLPLKLHADSDRESKWVLDDLVTNASVGKHLGEVVQGTNVPIISEDGCELGQWCDVEKVRKVYKLASGDAGKANKKNTPAPAIMEQQGHHKKQMESIILGTMALKGS